MNIQVLVIERSWKHSSDVLNGNAIVGGSFIHSLYICIERNIDEELIYPRLLALKFHLEQMADCSFLTVLLIFPQASDFLESLKGMKIVLVHGEGFGAWCWYKTIALLEESGLVPVALDLSGSGIDTKDTNSIATLVEYSKPLIAYIENLPGDEKVRCH